LWKSVTPKIISCEKDYATTLDKDTLKSALTGLASPEQTWPPAARIQKAKIEFSVTFFKVKTLTNRIRVMVVNDRNLIFSWCISWCWDSSAIQTSKYYWEWSIGDFNVEIEKEKMVWIKFYSSTCPQMMKKYMFM